MRWINSSYFSITRGGPRSAEYVALLSLTGAVVLGIVGVNVYASQYSPHLWLSIAGTGFLVANAALGVGGLLGFLFGIPRARQGEGAPGVSVTRYEPNTNLEQISDWLTKILVGVGLTQIAQLPDLFDRLTDFLKPGLGDSGSTKAFTAALLVYYSIAGFLLGYLWTSLHLAAAYSERDRDMEGAAFGAQLSAASLKAGLPVNAKMQSELLDQADRLGLKSRSSRILWADDNPNNNLFERQALSNLGLIVTPVETTDEAVGELGRATGRGAPYDLIISDMGRSGNPHAGEEMLARLRTEGHQQPVIFYAAGYDPSRPTPAGAAGMTNRPEQLVQLVLDALGQTTR